MILEMLLRTKVQRALILKIEIEGYKWLTGVTSVVTVDTNMRNDFKINQDLLDLQMLRMVFVLHLMQTTLKVQKNQVSLMKTTNCANSMRHIMLQHLANQILLVIPYFRS